MTRLPVRHAALVAAVAALAAAAAPTRDDVLVVVDAAGKEHRLKSWKFLAGTRVLAWLAPAPAEREGDAKGAREDPRAKARPPAGPEALEFREEDSTLFREGILTLVPLERLRALEYDPEKEAVTARVAAAGGGEAALTGTTKFQRVNKVVVEAEVDRGEQGVAEVRFQGGTARGVRAIRFPAPRPGAEPPAGRPAVITTAGKQPSAHKVADVQPLYRLAGGPERLSPQLLFKKTLRLDVAKVRKLTAAGDEEESAWLVVLKDGGEETLTLLRTAALDGKEAQLVGLLGRVPAGYKLFPMHTVAEVLFDATEPEPKPEAKPEAKPEPKPGEG
jgi:hypothetical protein